jgi:hypothetical protein
MPSSNARFAAGRSLGGAVTDPETSQSLAALAALLALHRAKARAWLAHDGVHITPSIQRFFDGSCNPNCQVDLDVWPKTSPSKNMSSHRMYALPTPSPPPSTSAHQSPSPTLTLSVMLCHDDAVSFAMPNTSTTSTAATAVQHQTMSASTTATMMQHQTTTSTFTTEMQMRMQQQLQQNTFIQPTFEPMQTSSTAMPMRQQTYINPMQLPVMFQRYSPTPTPSMLPPPSMMMPMSQPARTFRPVSPAPPMIPRMKTAPLIQARFAPRY